MRDDPGPRKLDLLSTRDAAEALGVCPQVLRMWVEQFDFPSTHRAGGRRAFDPREIDALQAVLAWQPAAEEAIPLARLSLGEAATGPAPEAPLPVPRGTDRALTRWQRSIDRGAWARRARAALLVAAIGGGLAGAPAAVARTRSRLSTNSSSRARRDRPADSSSTDRPAHRRTNGRAP